MARKEKNPNQIIRIDGNKCFLEALKSSFEIDKVLLNFIQYDVNKPQGSKFTSQIQIYLSFKDFESLYYETIFSGSLIRQINQLFNDPSKKEWEKQVILSRGGSKKDNNTIEARQLKIFKGRKKPIVLRAEIGKGKENAMGGYSMVGSPERYVDIAMEYKDLENFLLEIWKAINAHETVVSLNPKVDEMLFEIQKNREILQLIARQVGVSTFDVENIVNKEMPKPTYNNSQNNNQNTNQNNNQYQNNYSAQNNQQQNNYTQQNQYNNQGGYPSYNPQDYGFNH